VYLQIAIYANGVTGGNFAGNPYILLPFSTPSGSSESGFIPHYTNGIGSIVAGYSSGGQSKIFLSTAIEALGSLATGGSYGGSVRIYGDLTTRAA